MNITKKGSFVLETATLDWIHLMWRIWKVEVFLLSRTFCAQMEGCGLWPPITYMGSLFWRAPFAVATASSSTVSVLLCLKTDLNKTQSRVTSPFLLVF